MKLFCSCCIKVYNTFYVLYTPSKKINFIQRKSHCCNCIFFVDANHQMVEIVVPIILFLLQKKKKIDLYCIKVITYNNQKDFLGKYFSKNLVCIKRSSR